MWRVWHYQLCNNGLLSAINEHQTQWGLQNKKKAFGKYAYIPGAVIEFWFDLLFTANAARHLLASSIRKESIPTFSGGNCEGGRRRVLARPLLGTPTNTFTISYSYMFHFSLLLNRPSFSRCFTGPRVLAETKLQIAMSVVQMQPQGFWYPICSDCSRNVLKLKLVTFRTGSVLINAKVALWS